MVFAWIKNKIPHVSFVKKRMDGDVLILCSDALAIYYLNTTAAFLIDSADGKATVENIKDKFLKKYQVDESVLEQDIIDVIRDLQWKRIVRLE